MKPEIAEALVRHLYEGRSPCPDSIWAPGVSFRDPLVVVTGLDPISAMFAKINRLLPATELITFEPHTLSGHPCAWSMRVDYKRSGRSKAHTMRSILELDHSGGRVERMTEHWLSPLALRGDRHNRVGRLLRSGLGRMLGR